MLTGHGIDYRSGAKAPSIIQAVRHEVHEEQYQQAWAGDLKQVLREMKAAVDHVRAGGCLRLDPAVRDGLVARYDALLAAGLAANPPPQPRPHQRGRLKQSPARNLLERLWLGRKQVLAFLDDCTIPFDNN